MPFIAMLGCDGSGKSAVIDGITRELSEAGVPVTCGHWRPRPFQSSSSKSAQANVEDPHRLKPRGMVESVVKLAWIWLNWWVAWFTGLRRDARRGCLIFDRFHEDMQVDPRRYRYGGPRWLLKLGCRTMPRPDHVVYLDAPVDVLLSRKQEVSAEALEVARQDYLRLCESGGRYQVVDASKPLPEVIDTVLRLIEN